MVLGPSLHFGLHYKMHLPPKGRGGVSEISPPKAGAAFLWAALCP